MRKNLNIAILSILILSLSVLNGCKEEKESDKHALEYADQITGLASPIQLDLGKTTVTLEDYFLDVNQIDSIQPQEFIEWEKGSLTMSVSPEINAHTIDFFCKADKLSILVKKSRKQRVQISYSNTRLESIGNVQLAGDVNNWNPNQSNFSLQPDGIWILEMDLNPGKYSYQIVVDGEWQLDENNPVKVSNGMGGFNSVLEVKGNAEQPNLAISFIEGNQVELSAKASEEWEFVGLWENQKLEPSEPDQNTKRIRFTIPTVANKMERSHLRFVGFHEGQPSNDLIVPLEKGTPITKTEQLNRKDKHYNSIYFVLVDRFKDGNTEINEPLKDERVADRANYLGGDLKGVQQKIEDGYFKDLGFNSIWLSPITQNPLEAYQEYPEPRRYYSGYHGYWPISYKKVDHRFGSNEDFKALVDAAHANDKNIILDFASNHVHELHPIYQANPGWGTVLDLPDGRKNIRIWDEHRLTTWFDTFLPSLDFSREEIVQAVSDSAMYWVDEYQIDGYRHDATKHIPETFWRTLTKKIKTKHGSNVYQIGETFGSRELIGSYVSSGQQDGQFDFNLYFDIRATLLEEEGSYESLNASLYESFDYYGWHSLMGNITGNHDIPRFISYAGGDLKMSEDPKEAGWNRVITVKDTMGYRRLNLLHAFITTIPGIPVVYYGDEFGMTGAGDPDNRKMMRFKNLSNHELTTKGILSKLMKLRNENMALIYGDFKTLHVDKDSWIYQRKYLNNQVTVYLNKSNKNIKLPYHDEWGDDLKLNFYGNIENEMVELAPYSFEILTTN